MRINESCEGFHRKSHNKEKDHIKRIESMESKNIVALSEWEGHTLSPVNHDLTVN